MYYEADSPKPKRGRPRKSESRDPPQTFGRMSSPSPGPGPQKRGRGRPRKSESRDPDPNSRGRRSRTPEEWVQEVSEEVVFLYVILETGN